MCTTFYCSEVCQTADKEEHAVSCARTYKPCTGCKQVVLDRAFPCAQCRLNFFCSKVCLDVNGARHLQLCVPSPGALSRKEGHTLHELVGRDSETLKSRMFLRIVDKLPPGLELFTSDGWTYLHEEEIPDVHDRNMLVKRINSCAFNEVACGVMGPVGSIRVCTVSFPGLTQK